MDGSIHRTETLYNREIYDQITLFFSLVLLEFEN